MNGKTVQEEGQKERKGKKGLRMSEDRRLLGCY